MDSTSTVSAQAILDGLACNKYNCPCVKSSGKGRGNTHCPGHNDKTPSLTVDFKNGQLLIRCRAGCSQEQVIDALRERGLWSPNGHVDIPKKSLVGTPSPRRHGSEAPRKVLATYDYRDAKGTMLFQAVRYEPKDFGVRRPDGRGGWIHNIGDVTRVLYRLPELVASEPSDPVHITEGEKDVDRLAGLGLVATTNVFGADKWQDEYAEHLSGRHVIIHEDNDNAGKARTEKVARSLIGIAASIRVVRYPELHEKGDVTDWLDLGNTREQLLERVSAAPEFDPSDVSSVSSVSSSDPPHAKSARVGVPPFPINVLPVLARRVVAEGAASLQCPPDLVATPLLAKTAGVIGNRVDIEVKPGYRQPAILWAGVIAQPKAETGRHSCPRGGERH